MIEIAAVAAAAVGIELATPCVDPHKARTLFRTRTLMGPHR